MGICLSTTITSATWIYYKLVNVLKCHFLIHSYTPQPWNITPILKLAPVEKWYSEYMDFISSVYQLCILRGTYRILYLTLKSARSEEGNKEGVNMKTWEEIDN